jgi:hypothetical protein
MTGPEPGVSRTRITHEQLAMALQRLKAQTKLADARVREVLTEALRHVELNPPPQPTEPIERVIMLATSRLCAEEGVPSGHSHEPRP